MTNSLKDEAEMHSNKDPIKIKLNNSEIIDNDEIVSEVKKLLNRSLISKKTLN